jgi:hypothetical protein
MEFAVFSAPFVRVLLIAPTSVVAIHKRNAHENIHVQYAITNEDEDPSEARCGPLAEMFDPAVQVAVEAVAHSRRVRICDLLRGLLRLTHAVGDCGTIVALTCEVDILERRLQTCAQRVDTR